MNGSSTSGRTMGTPSFCMRACSARHALDDWALSLAARFTYGVQHTSADLLGANVDGSAGALGSATANVAVGWSF